MSILVSGISLALGAGEEEAKQAAKKVAGIQGDVSAKVVKKSIDARKKPMIKEVFSVEFDLADEKAEKKAVERAAKGQVSFVPSVSFEVTPGGEKLSHRPVVVGLGPAGLFAALLLAREGYRPLVLERGADVETRCEAVERFWKTGEFSPITNVQFGEGGAGTFSDGKLTTRTHDPRCKLVLEEFYAHGAPERILWQAKPHIGTDILRNIVKGIREEIINLGGEVRFLSKVDEVSCEGGALRSLTVDGETILCEAAILAIGHSARDTYEALLEKGMMLEAKPFSCGARIEHPQRLIDEALYGKAAGDPRLPAGEYQLSHRKGTRAVYTFCMCPGGSVVASASEEGGIVTNGMSTSDRGGENANAALVVSVGPEDFGDHPLDGVRFQRNLEQAAYRVSGSYHAPCQSVRGFLGRKAECASQVLPTYTPGVIAADLHTILPSFITEMMEEGLSVFERKMRGYSSGDALLTGVETRTSSPVRILRGENLEAVGKKGIYPCGEGAGYAGGIMSAAVDGLRVATALIEKYAPLAD